MRQEASKAIPPAIPNLDEPGEEDLRLKLEKSAHLQWEQQRHESVSDWLARINELLESNSEELKLAERELIELLEEEKQLNARINLFVRKNQEMRNHEPRKAQEEDSTKEGQVKPKTADIQFPFTVHLVQEGDTLYSIAEKYYASGDRYQDLFLWNQGWVRDEDHIVAGLGLVLFLPHVKKKNEKTIAQYIMRLESE